MEPESQQPDNQPDELEEDLTASDADTEAVENDPGPRGYRNGANDEEPSGPSVARTFPRWARLTATVTDMGTEVDGAVQTLEDADLGGELVTAFADADSCGELR